MIRALPFGARCAAALFVMLLAAIASGVRARADGSAVIDQTGLVPKAVVASIDARNEQLYGATGEEVVVAVVRGDAGQSAQNDGVALADQIAPGRYGALVWIATIPGRSDLLFFGRALHWVPYDTQIALRKQLSYNIRYCCPGDSLGNLVDMVAAYIIAGSKTAPSATNYVRDRLGELNAQQVQTIVDREQRLESATGKGIAVTLFPEEQQTPSGELAYSIARTMNVNGRVAGILWVDRGQTALHFAVEQAPGFDTIAPSSLTAINAAFESDMQTGRFGDAVVAAVDRLATAIEGTSTPMPTLAPEPEAPAPLPTQTTTPPGIGLLRWLPGSGGSPALTAAFLIFILAIAALIGYLMRRADRGEE